MSGMITQCCRFSSSLSSCCSISSVVERETLPTMALRSCRSRETAKLVRTSIRALPQALPAALVDRPSWCALLWCESWRTSSCGSSSSSSSSSCAAALRSIALAEASLCIVRRCSAWASVVCSEA